MAKGLRNPSYRKRIGYQSALLGGMSMLAAAALSVGFVETQADIALRTAEDIQASLAQVISPTLHDNDLLADALTLKIPGRKRPATVYRAIHDSRVTAVAFESSGQGYGGEIVVLMGVAADGNVLGVRVISHAETPGLGDRIEAQRDDWILGFNGHSLTGLGPQGWAVKKDGGRFDQFTGATITPRAVVGAVKSGLEQFTARRAELLALPAPEAETGGQPRPATPDTHSGDVS